VTIDEGLHEVAGVGRALAELEETFAHRAAADFARARRGGPGESARSTLVIDFSSTPSLACSVSSSCATRFNAPCRTERSLAASGTAFRL
jgi:hypothetical protein